MAPSSFTRVLILVHLAEPGHYHTVQDVAQVVQEGVELYLAPTASFRGLDLSAMAVYTTHEAYIAWTSVMFT